MRLSYPVWFRLGRVRDGPGRPAGIAGRQPTVSSMATSDRVELPGDVVSDVPEIAGIGLTDERVSAPLVPPIEQIDILPASKGGRLIGLFRRADNQAQRPDRLVVGRVDELRRGPAVGDHDSDTAEVETPGLQVGQPHLLRKALADLLQRLARIAGGRYIDQRAVAAGAHEQLVIARVVEPGIVGSDRLRRSL